MGDFSACMFTFQLGLDSRLICKGVWGRGNGRVLLSTTVPSTTCTPGAREPGGVRGMNRKTVVGSVSSVIECVLCTAYGTAARHASCLSLSLSILNFLVRIKFGGGV